MDSREVMVSISCTAYNHERYIGKAIEGFVSQQTDFRYEVLIHDDASTDSTAQIIREYAEKYPDVIRPIYQTQNQYSQGVNIGRDIIMPQVRGKYIAYCEGDDYWIDPHKLQKQVDFLEKHPEYSATAHNCCFVGADGEEIENIYPIYRPYTSHRFTLKRFSREVVYPGQTATIVCRKSVYTFASEEERNAFYGIRTTTGDKRSMLKMLLAGDIYCFEDVMSAYRIVTQSGDSWSAANYGKNLSYFLHITSIDFRSYVKKYHGKPYANYYTTFHTGAAGVLKAFLRPSPQNKEVCRQIVQEHHGWLGTAVYLLGVGILSIPLYFMREKERRKYDPKD